MNHNVTLSLPLSATALREGAEFLNKLSALADVIRKETYVAGEPVHTTLGYTIDVDTSEAVAKLAEVGALAADVAIAEAATVLQPAPIEYEDVVVGHVRNPEYTGANAAFGQEDLIAAGWSIDLLVADGYLLEQTEKRPKPSAPGASVVSAPAPPAPAPAAPNTSAPGSAETDKDGIVWDARIHSDAAEKLSKEGFWKRRRGVTDELWASVRAELGLVQPEPVTPPSPPAPGAGASIPPTPPAPNPGANLFADFTKWIMPYMKAGKLDETKNVLAVQKAGLSKLVDLAKHPELIPTVKADLIATYGL